LLIALIVKVNDEKIIKNLGKQGFSTQQGQALLDEVKIAIQEYESSPEGKKDFSKKYRNMMVAGVLWTVGGAIATIIGYSTAADNPSGGSYYVFWGAVVFGIFDFIRGLFGWMKYQGK